MRLIWIDLEMTGLNAERDRILEIATVITDEALEIVATGPCLVLGQPEDVLVRMDQWNLRQHTQSGLLDQVRGSVLSDEGAEQQTLEFLAKHCNAGEVPLAGNSLHRDRQFLLRHMPRLESFFHYRNVDVSTVKELARRWYPEKFLDAPPKNTRHRSIDDIHESIEELRYYRSAIFSV